MQLFGGIDILVNCIATNHQPIEHVTAQDFETLVNVNLRSVFFLCQAACLRMKERGGGKIVNIGSVTSHIGLANLSVYGITKSAVPQLARTMALEWARKNIQVNCVAPGFVQTR